MGVGATATEHILHRRGSGSMKRVAAHLWLHEDDKEQVHRAQTGGFGNQSNPTRSNSQASWKSWTHHSVISKVTMRWLVARFHLHGDHDSVCGRVILRLLERNVRALSGDVVKITPMLAHVVKCFFVRCSAFCKQGA